ncbi:MAG: fused MFS/spermidine synthase [Myxococcota bacterium]
MTCLFFLSGAAGLVYQVLWMRSLGLFFGSDMYGVSIILSTFMGGLAIGSLAGGRLAEWSWRPLMLYGLAELGIGLFAVSFSSILQMFEPLLLSVYPAEGASTGGYHLMRVVLASATLLVPTTLMGATLPLILRHFIRTRSVLGGMAAYFYAINTLGALVGTLVAGFILLPYLGMSNATLCTAAINFLVGTVCTVLGLRASIPEQMHDAVDEPASAALDPLPGVPAEVRRRIAFAALLALGISGFGSFALEVVWTRILLISFSATVYSFASMLSCFLFGIFLGSALISRIVDDHEDPVGLFALLELGVAACVAALCLLINAVPGLFGTMLGNVAALMPFAKGYSLVVATLGASFVLLVIPTTLLGATFSVALRIYTTNVAQVGSRTGNLYFSNTLGAIVGSLGAGLVLIPAIGTRGSLSLIALLFAANGLYLAFSRRGLTRLRPALQPLLGAAAVVLVLAAVGLSLPYRVALNFNQNAGAETELLYHSEGIQNTIDVVRSRSGVTSLIIGGNVEADNGYTQRRHFVLKGHLPLVFLEDPKDVLVVGLGMGITLRSTTRHPGLERVDVVELAPEILAAQAHLRDVNDDVARNDLVHIRIDDGRSYMKMSDRTYDMVTADPIHPKVSRVGYLYTKEYYQSIKERLGEGGVVCQWMPIYQISPKRLRSAMKSFAEVFPNATFWYVKNHGLFVAKVDSPVIDYELLAERFQDPAVRDDMASVDIDSPEEFLALMLMGPDEVRAFIDADPDVPVNTDDYPYLEYFVPGDLFYTPEDNVRALVKHLVDPTQFVRNQPPDSVARVRELIEGRAERLVAEVSSAAREERADHQAAAD